MNWKEYIDSFDNLTLDERIIIHERVHRVMANKLNGSSEKFVETDDLAIILNSLKLYAERYSDICRNHPQFIDERLFRKGEENDS